MLAQRDMLRRMKEEKRQKELSEFNTKLEDASSAQQSRTIADDFRQMDASKKAP